jgi:hypothetical protein
MPKRYGKSKKTMSKSRSNYKKNRRKRKTRKMRKGGCGSTTCSNAGSSLSTAAQWYGKGGSDDAMNSDLYKHFTDNSPYRSSK